MSKFITNCMIELVFSSRGYFVSDGEVSVKGTLFRICCNGVVEISDNDFDRWANSVGDSLDCFKRSGVRQLIKRLDVI